MLCCEVLRCCVGRLLRLVLVDFFCSTPKNNFVILFSSTSKIRIGVTIFFDSGGVGADADEKKRTKKKKKKIKKKKTKKRRKLAAASHRRTKAARSWFGKKNAGTQNDDDDDAALDERR